MVTMLPISIRTRITSAALIDIDCASSATVIVSGTATSRVTGSVGFSKACWPAVADVILLGLIAGRGLRRPRLPSARCSSPFDSVRSLPLRFLPFSSRRLGVFASSAGGVTGWTFSSAVTSGAGASATSAAARASASAAIAFASSSAFRAVSSSAKRAFSASSRSFAS